MEASNTILTRSKRHTYTDEVPCLEEILLHYFLVVYDGDACIAVIDLTALQVVDARRGRTEAEVANGIGMLIVQRIMREHNGFVEIKTKASIGSVVSLKFPLPEPMMRKIETERSKSLKEGKKKKKS